MTVMGGYMLHGVKRVIVELHKSEIVDSERTTAVLDCDGRVYMWANGALTVYSDDPSVPWQIIPAYRVIAIEGGEHG
jgi:hypothetical protein